jgi:transglutaminase-like putative cysteine protease
MRLRIQHRTAYRYARPVTLQPHRPMLFPRGSHFLAVHSSQLRCSPEAELEWTQDVFGNLITTARFGAATDALVIESDLVVEQSAAAWPVFRIAPEAHAYPFAYAESDAADLGALLRSRHEDGQEIVAGWARGFVQRPGTDTLSLLQDLNAGILDRVAYRTREEEGTQSPLETLNKGSGSCRDIAALFIDAVRRLGFGARAVSGYQFDPDGPDDAESTHAWAEVYLPCAGWIAFDPTHRRMGSHGLIPVSVARSNEQTMPVSGDYLGMPEDFLGIDVRVAMTAG